MQPRRSSSFAVSVLACLPLLAQKPNDGIVGSVSLSASRNFVTAARSLQLNGRVLNVRGAILRNRTLQFEVGDSSRASVSDSGLLVGLQVGPVDVKAIDTASGVSTTQRYYVYPDKVSIATPATSLQVGDTLKLSLQLLDADGKSLNPVPVQWFTDLPAVGKIASDGTLSGLIEGRVTAGVTLDMGPGFSHFSAYQPLQIQRRADYRLRPIISSAPTSTATTLVPTKVSAMGTNVATITNLSSGGQAAILSQPGKTRTLLTTGTTVNGRVVSQLQSVSVNSRGDVLLLTGVEAEWCGQQLLLYTAASQWALKVLDDINGCNYYMPSVQSLDSLGGVVYWNWTGNTLKYRKPDGTIQTIVSVGDKPAGIGTISGVNNWSFTPYDNLVIEFNLSGSPVTYAAWDRKALTKLFSVGISVGTRSSEWARLPRETAPGDYITRIGGSNWSSISRLANGALTAVVSNGNGDTAPGWIHDNFDGAGGSVYFVADITLNGSTRRAVFRNQSGTNAIVGDYAQYNDVSQLNAVDGNTVFVWGTQDTGVLRLNQAVGNAATSVLPTGTTVDLKSGPGLTRAGIPRGIGTNGIVRTSGDALYQVQGATLTPLLKPGDTLVGAKVSAVQTVAGAPAGNIAFVAQTGTGGAQGLFTYRNGQYARLINFVDLIAGATVYGIASGDQQVAVNNQGHVAAYLYMSTVNGVYLFSSPAVRNIVSVGDGVPGTSLRISSISQVAIDENDRVAIMAGLSNSRNGILLWDKGSLREIFEVQQNDPLKRPFTYFSNLYAAGTTFYLSGGISGSNEHLALDGTNVTLMATNGQTTGAGIALTGVLGGQIAANSKGDFAFQSITGQGQGLFVKRAGGKDAVVALSSQQGPDNEWFLQIFGAGLSDQGDVVFAALVWQNGTVQVKYYQATPLN